LFNLKKKSWNIKALPQQKRAKDDTSNSQKYETLPMSLSHNSRAQSSHSADKAVNNQDIIFLPPKTPVHQARSKTKEPQYHTPSKLITKSGEHIASSHSTLLKTTTETLFITALDSMKVKVTPSKSVDSDLNIFSPSTPVSRKYAPFCCHAIKGHSLRAVLLKVTIS
jgi:hypothetical protein